MLPGEPPRPTAVPTAAQPCTVYGQYLRRQNRSPRTAARPGKTGLAQWPEGCRAGLLLKSASPAWGWRARSVRPEALRQGCRLCFQHLQGKPAVSQAHISLPTRFHSCEGPSWEASHPRPRQGTPTSLPHTSRDSCSTSRLPKEARALPRPQPLVCPLPARGRPAKPPPTSVPPWCPRSHAGLCPLAGFGQWGHEAAMPSKVPARSHNRAAACPRCWDAPGQRAGGGRHRNTTELLPSGQQRPAPDGTTRANGCLP